MISPDAVALRFIPARGSTGDGFHVGKGGLPPLPFMQV